MNIALIGYRGTGKTTVGKLVAAALNFTFIDADAALEERLGRSIREIFATEGESYFRDRESEILAELCQGDRQVLSLGGGVVLREGNRHQLREVCQRVVWLQADIEILVERLHGDPATAAQRPPLTSLPGRAEIEQLLAQRTPLYAECAEFTIDTSHRSPEHIAQEIVSLVMG
jgi:shikimate kinase